LPAMSATRLGDFLGVCSVADAGRVESAPVAASPPKSELFKNLRRFAVINVVAMKSSGAV
jgi:hypothetical protein